MTKRLVFLLCLDTTMLLLVVVLECINFTGLQWHQWLGFAFCPVVLLHVVLQWQWFITQLQRILTPGAWRVRVNAGLNLLLLWLMAAVLFSGVFVSSQAVEAWGESFGRVRIWSEVHGWLNVSLVVAVGLHLGLNWDWVLAAFRRKRPERSAAVSETSRNAGADASRTAALHNTEPATPRTGLGIESVSDGSAKSPHPGPLPVWRGEGGRKPARSLGRAMALLLVASVAAGGSYFAMKAILFDKMRARTEREQVVAAGTGRGENQSGRRSTDLAKNPLAPRHRPLRLRKAPDVAGALGLTVFAAVIGRYVLRLRL